MPKPSNTIINIAPTERQQPKRPKPSYVWSLAIDSDSLLGEAPHAPLGAAAETCAHKGGTRQTASLTQVDPTGARSVRKTHSSCVCACDRRWHRRTPAVACMLHRQPSARREATVPCHHQLGTEQLSTRNSKRKRHKPSYLPHVPALVRKTDDMWLAWKKVVSRNRAWPAIRPHSEPRKAVRALSI